MKTLIEYTAYGIIFRLDINAYPGWEWMKNRGAFKPANDDCLFREVTI